MDRRSMIFFFFFACVYLKNHPFIDCSMLVLESELPLIMSLGDEDIHHLFFHYSYRKNFLEALYQNFPSSCTCDFRA